MKNKKMAIALATVIATGSVFGTTALAERELRTMDAQKVDYDFDSKKEVDMDYGKEGYEYQIDPRIEENRRKAKEAQAIRDARERHEVEVVYLKEKGMTLTPIHKVTGILVEDIDVEGTSYSIIAGSYRVTFDEGTTPVNFLVYEGKDNWDFKYDMLRVKEKVDKIQFMDLSLPVHYMTQMNNPPRNLEEEMNTVKKPVEKPAETISEPIAEPRALDIFADDVQGKWYSEDLNEATKLGIFGGKKQSNGTVTFEPNDLMKSEEFYKTVGEMFGTREDESNPLFKGLKEYKKGNKWYTPYSEALLEAGIIADESKVGTTINRGEALRILTELATKAELEGIITINTSGFSDVQQGTKVLNIVTGFEGNQLKPNEDLTRAQAMTMLMRVLNQYK